MNNLDFFILLNSSIWIYVTSLSVTVALFYITIKYYNLSLLNPLVFSLFTFLTGFSAAIFLYSISKIDLNGFFYLVVSSLIFWIILLSLLRRKNTLVRYRIKNETKISNFIFFGAYSSYLAFNILTYYLIGIPIFNEDSRLSTYAGSGLGFLERLQPAVLIYSLFYIFNKINGNSGKIGYYLLFMPIMIFGILSGSRSSFLIVAFSFWGYRTFYLGVQPNFKNVKKLFLVVIVLTLISFLFQWSGDYYFALISFLERIVASGDIYWYAMPNETWLQVTIQRPIEHIFTGFLGPLRIIDTAKSNTPIGFQLTSIVNPSMIDAKTGPVALFQIFGLISFGWVGGAIFSGAQGLLAGFALRITSLRSNSLLLSSLFYLFYYSSIMLLGDISFGFGIFLSALLGVIYLSLFVLISQLFYKCQRG